jgi:hypothetical protein
MLSRDLARDLKRSGLEWIPRLHDAFLIPDRDLDDQVFVISDLTIDVERLAGHATIMFNGAVEWSLDYIFSQDVVWLPSEEQLRELLGDPFQRLVRHADGFSCEIDVDGVTLVFSSSIAANAYGKALLHLLYADHEAPAALFVPTDTGGEDEPR